MFRISSLIIIILFFFWGCKTSPSVFKSPSIVERFDSGMVKVVKKYSDNYGKKLDPPKSSHSYSLVFDLKRRVLLPNLNLTFDFRSYTPCGGCWTYQVVHVYNDSMSFILPMTDDEIYWKMSSKQNDSSNITISPNFSNELNAMIKYFNISDYEMKRSLINEIMRNQGFWKIDKSDIPKLTMITNDLIQNDFYSKACRDKLLGNLKNTEASVKQGKIVYSDGVNVAMFTIYQDQDILIEFANTECNSRMLY